jgi:hypothetical protein
MVASCLYRRFLLVRNLTIYLPNVKEHMIKTDLCFYRGFSFCEILLYLVFVCNIHKHGFPPASRREVFYCIFVPAPNLGGALLLSTCICDMTKPPFNGRLFLCYVTLPIFEPLIFKAWQKLHYKTSRRKRRFLQIGKNKSSNNTHSV